MAEQKTGTTKKTKRDILDEALKRINNIKEFKRDSGDKLISRLSDRQMDVEYISTGSVALDSILGGGLPKGRVVEIYGAESSGKTTISLIACGNVQQEGGLAAFIDLEHAFDPRYAKKLGVDIENIAISQPTTAEEALGLVQVLCKTGIFDIVVIDSVAAMVPQEELEKSSSDPAQIGGLARVMSRSLKKIIQDASQNNTTVVFINQVRSDIGKFQSFGEPLTTTGGKALKFYASQRIEVKRVKSITEGKDPIGNLIRMKVVKNKVAPPFLTTESVITFNRGINQAAEMIEVAPHYGVIQRPNNRTYIEAETGEVIGTSRAEALQKIEDTPELLKRLSVALSQAMRDNLLGDDESVGKQETNNTQGSELDEELEDILES